MSELRAAAEQPQPDLAERLERIARALPNVADCDAPQVELREIAMCLRSLPVEQPVAWLVPRRVGMTVIPGEYETAEPGEAGAFSVYAAPPPPAAAPTDAQDAARYRWLREGIVGVSDGLHRADDGTEHMVYKARCMRLTMMLRLPSASPTTAEIDAAIDAGMRRSRAAIDAALAAREAR